MVIVKTLGRHFNERIEREMGNIVDTVEDKIVVCKLEFVAESRGRIKKFSRNLKKILTYLFFSTI